MIEPGVLSVGGRVRVTTELVEINGSTRHHPHAGKTGVVSELLGVRLTGPDWKPRAMVKIDAGEDAGNFMVVSLEFLEPL